MGRVLANGLGDQGSILGWVILKTKKRYLIPPCLTFSIIRYGSRIKWSNQRKRVAPSPTPWRSSCWKGSRRVALAYGLQLYLQYVGHIMWFYRFESGSLRFKCFFDYYMTFYEAPSGYISHIPYSLSVDKMETFSKYCCGLVIYYTWSVFYICVIRLQFHTRCEKHWKKVVHLLSRAQGSNSLH